MPNIASDDKIMRSNYTKSLYPLLLVMIFLHTITLFGHENPDSKSIAFVKNLGQWEDDVCYKVNLQGGAVFLEERCITYVFLNGKQWEQFHQQKFSKENRISAVGAHAYKVHFKNANPNPKFAELEKHDHYHNYFLGNDAKRWSSEVPLFRKIVYQELYPNIDMIYTQANGTLKYEFHVAAHADPSDIVLEFEGADKLSLQKGNLVIHTSVGEIRELAPVTYQIINGKKRHVASEYDLKKDEIRFHIGEYNPDYPLIIDPTLVFSTYTGSTADNWGFTATYDNAGNAFGGGIAFATGYPTTTGAYQINYAGGACDITITKFNATGTHLLFSTYIGGSLAEQPHSLICNRNGELYIFGTTSSINFPITAGAFQTQYGGGMNLHLSNSIQYTNGSDIVVVKLNNTGTQLLGSTFVGGSGNDGLLTEDIPLRKNYADECRGEVVLDNNSNVYVVSTTNSTDFPTTANAFSPQNNGNMREAILFKMNYNLTDMVWSTYFGGTGMDAGYSLTTCEDNSVYFCGGTTSENLPTRYPAYQNVKPGGVDGFVAHISNDGSTLLHSTYLGRAQYDQAYLVKCDKLGFPHIYGQTEDDQQNWVINAQWHQGNGQFITKMQKELNDVIWSTEFGTNNFGPDLSPTALLVDLCNKIYMSGWASTRINGFGGTSGLPITVDALQNTTDNNDYYFICISDDASSLEYATFFGSDGTIGGGDEHVDGGTSRFDNKGRIYQAVCAGCGGHSNFPTTAGVWSQTNNSHNCNLAVIKMDFNLPVVISDFNAPTTDCAPTTINFSNQSQEISNNTNYFWDFGDGTTSTQASPTHAYNNPGTYIITLVAQDAGSCNFADTLQQTLLILGNTTINLDTLYMCNDAAVQIGVPPAPGGEVTYQWIPNMAMNDSTISNPFVAPTEPTLYTCYISNGICYDTLQQWVLPSAAQYNLPGEIFCCVDSSITIDPQMVAPANTTFQWSTNFNFSNTLNADPSNPILTYTPTDPLTTLYLKIIIGDCEEIASVIVRIEEIDVNIPETVVSCFEESVQIPLEANSGDYTYQWSPSEHIVSGEDSAQPWILPPATMTYTVTITSEHGCTAVESITVTKQTGTFPFAVEAWTSETDIFYGDTTHLFCTTFNDGHPYQYSWTPEESLDNPNEATTIARPTHTTTYLVEVTDIFGCKMWDTVNVKVIEKYCGEPLIFIPNAFTPNGDGKNDKLFVRSEIIESFIFRIYNRWGELIFETQNLNEGWDGKFKGENCPPGVYDYYYEGTCVGESHATYKTSGNITLIR